MLPSFWGIKSLMLFYFLGLIGILALFSNRLAEIISPFDKIKFKKVFLFLIIIILVAVQLNMTMVSPLMGDGTMYLYEFDRYFDNMLIEFGIKSPFDISIKLFDYVLDLFQNKTKIKFIVNEWSWRLNSIIGFCIFALTIKPLLQSTTDDKRLLPFKIAIALTLGCIASFSNFIEFIPMRLALFTLYLMIYFNALQNDKPNPWIIFSASFFLLGYYIAFLPILPALIYLLWIKRRHIKAGMLNWGSALGTTLLVFALLIHFTVGIDPFVMQIFSGREVLSYIHANEIQKNLSAFSAMHLADFVNVMILHSPFILFFAAFISILLILNRKYIRDEIIISLFLTTVVFYLEVYVLNSVWGLFADWDIFSYPAILTTLLFLRILELSHKSPKTWRTISAAIIPLSLGQLIFWISALHSQDYIYQRLVSNNKYPRNEKMWASSLTTYEISNNFISPSVEKCFLEDSEIQLKLIYFLTGKNPSEKILYLGDSISVDSLIRHIVESTGDKLSALDLTNIANFYLDFDEDYALYYLRKSEKLWQVANPNIPPGDCFMVSTVIKLAVYYHKINFTSTEILYGSLLPDDQLKIASTYFYDMFKDWEKDGTYENNVQEAREIAAKQIYNNAVRLFKEEKYQTALWEFETAKAFGMENEQLENAVQALNKYLAENNSEK